MKLVLDLSFAPFKFKLVEAFAGPAVVASLFCFLHWVEGRQPLVTEFEWGAIVAIWLLRLQEAINIYLEPVTRPDRHGSKT